MQTFFTSDTHFDDEFAISYFSRPFESVDEMNAVMVERWNRVVTDEDLIYHLGDFTTEDLSHFTKWVKQLNGTIRILPGNMDRLWLKDFVASEKVQVVAPLMTLEFSEIGTGRQPQMIVLCHYSMQVWELFHHGSWHLFGHTHGKLKGIGMSFDVGVDCTDFVPLSLESVLKFKIHRLTTSTCGGCWRYKPWIHWKEFGAHNLGLSVGIFQATRKCVPPPSGEVRSEILLRRADDVQLPIANQTGV